MYVPRYYMQWAALVDTYVRSITDCRLDAVCTLYCYIRILAEYLRPTRHGTVYSASTSTFSFFMLNGAHSSYSGTRMTRLVKKDTAAV